MRSTTRLRGLLVLPALLGLSACATYNPAYGGLPFPFPGDDGRYGRQGDYGGYGSSNEYRRVDSDAYRYASEVDRAIGLSSSEERGVARVVRDRAHDLLRRTHPSEHRYVYPFPRDRYEGNTRNWWQSTDRAVERVLSSRSRRAYRDWVNGDYYGGYNNRDGYYDRGRYGDGDYRGRRYDPVYNDARRAAARREAEIERRRQAEARRREDARRRYEDERREDARRRDDARRRYEDERRDSDRRRQEMENRQRRENELQRRQEAERRAAEARRDREDRRRQETRSGDRRPERGAERPRRESERGNDSRRRDERRRSDDSRDRDEARDNDADRERSADRGRGRGARPQRGS